MPLLTVGDASVPVSVRNFQRSVTFAIGPTSGDASPVRATSRWKVGQSPLAPWPPLPPESLSTVSVPLVTLRAVWPSLRILTM